MFPQKEDPIIAFVDAIANPDNPSVAIEHQEARGQHKLVNSEVLPHDFNHCKKEVFEKMGIVYGAQADDIFSYVTLPAGWKKEATNHSMWSYLLDDKGRRRAAIFYKAAFYDRSAHISPVRRYSYMSMPVLGYDNPDYRAGEWIGVVKDGESIIWQTSNLRPEPPHNQEDRSIWLKWHEEKQGLENDCKTWLDEYYPEWNDYLAYWD